MISSLYAGFQNFPFMFLELFNNSVTNNVEKLKQKEQNKVKTEK